MKTPIIECVPNFSEGRDPKVIDQITKAISNIEHVKLLHVDVGHGANRTVITFAGPAPAVVEAAYLAIQVASERIDMRQHSGTHPRMGATDVCPLIPISNISLEETVKYAYQLGERVGCELGIPIYMYEANASKPHRKNLAKIRSGEYEGLAKKMQQALWISDYGPTTFNAKSGATVIGARNFLIAYNVNLNTDSVEIANKIAQKVRTSGYLQTLSNGEKVRVPGKCPGLKAIGWYIQEYGFAQVSMNLVDIQKTGMHHAFEACKIEAKKLGVEVIGSELIGLVPLKALTEAGHYYLKPEAPEEVLINAAIQNLGLNQIQVFNPRERIIEYKLQSEMF